MRHSLVSFALTLALVALGFIARGCVDAGRMAEAEAHARALAARADSIAAVADTRLHAADRLRMERDSALVLLSTAERERDAARIHASEALTRYHTLVVRYQQTGDVADCDDALTACAEAVAAAEAETAAADSLAAHRGRLLLLATAEADTLRSAYDDVAAALGMQRDAYEIQALATEAWQGRAHGYRTQRNVAIGVGAAAVLTILLLK